MKIVGEIPSGWLLLASSSSFFPPLFPLLFDAGIQIKEDGFRVRKFYQLLLPHPPSLSFSPFHFNEEFDLSFWMIDDTRMFGIRMRFDSIFIQGSRMLQKWKKNLHWSRKENNRIKRILHPVSNRFEIRRFTARKSSIQFLISYSFSDRKNHAMWKIYMETTPAIDKCDRGKKRKKKKKRK